MEENLKQVRRQLEQRGEAEYRSYWIGPVFDRVSYRVCGPKIDDEEYPSLEEALQAIEDFEPERVDTWIFTCTEGGEFIKWGKDGDTEYPLAPGSQEITRQLYLLNGDLDKTDRLYVLDVFSNGQMKQYEVDRHTLLEASMPSKYSVTWSGCRKDREFSSLQDAVIFAREKAVDLPMFEIVSIWNETGLVSVVVSESANGLTVHRLKDWPQDEECAYE